MRRHGSPCSASPRATITVGLIGAVALAVLTGCAARVETEHSDYDEFGDRRDTHSIETSLVSRDNADLQRAQTLARDGNYREAIAILEGLHAQTGLKPELRQDVLLALGAMYGDWRNGLKDYDKGLRYLRELLADFPETPHRERAIAMMETYEKARETR